MVKNLVKELVSNVVSKTDSILSKGAGKIDSKIGQVADDLTNKIDSIKINELNTEISSKSHFVLDQVTHVIEEGMTGFASLAQTNVDKIIQNSAIPEIFKQTLIENANEGILAASSAFKDKVEKLEQAVEVLVDSKLPLIEEKLANFIKKVIMGMKNFAEKTIDKFEAKIDKFKTKIDDFINNHDIDNSSANDTSSLDYDIDLGGALEASNTYEF